MDIVDALVVSLKLDPAEFKKGRKEASAEFTKMRAESVKHAKAIKEANEAVSEGFSKLKREALTFFALLTGARSVKEYVAQMTAANTEMGKFAQNIGEAPKIINAIGMGIERLGGSADEAKESLGTLSRAFFDAANNGKALPDAIYRVYAAADNKLIDKDHGLLKFLTDTADALKIVEKKKGRSAAFFSGKDMGLTDNTINLMLQYGAGFGKYVNDLSKFSVTDGSIRAGGELTAQFAAMRQEAKHFASVIYERVVPAITEIMKSMNAWITKNGEWIDQNINKYIDQLAAAIEAANRFLSESPQQTRKREKAALGMTPEQYRNEYGGVAAAARGGYRARLEQDSGLLPEAGFGSLFWSQSQRDEYDAKLRAVRGMTDQQLIDAAKSRQRFQNDFGMLPGRATGGPVQAGRAYMVGERGPEPFIPGTSGTILPNSFMGGSVQVDGRNVNRGNPLPVTLKDGSGEGGGKSLLEWLFGRSSGPGGSVVGASDADGGTGSTGSTKARGNLRANQQIAYKAARAAGLSETAAKALVANFSGESLANPADHHWDRTHYSQGIAQWDTSRARAIKRQFGKFPKDMTIAEQVNAAIWEMQNNPAYARAWGALQGGGSAADMIGALVENYERPADTRGATRNRMQFYNGFEPSTIWSGTSVPSVPLPSGAALSSVTNNHPVTTSSRSSSMHIENINVNAPQAKDARGIAGGIKQALADFNFAAMANSGQV